MDALHKATRNHIASNINTIDTSNGEGIQLGNEDGFVPKSEYSEDAAEYIAKKNSTSTMYTKSFIQKPEKDMSSERKMPII